jgi:cysteinyl-tRNA synthetase
MHNNMITINGQKMGKSLGNFITLEELFTGKHPLLEKAYSPMAIRFFILQAHYRSTVDFSNEALQASEKGLTRLMEGIRTLNRITPSATGTAALEGFESDCYQALCDDLNSPVVIALLFDGLRHINAAFNGQGSLSASDLEMLRRVYHTFVFDILGLRDEQAGDNHGELLEYLIGYLLDIRQEAKAAKDYATSDKIRKKLSELGVDIKDRKDGADWSFRSTAQ